MTEDDIRNVQASFDLLKERADQFGATFYDHLFATHPQLRAMFAEDIAPQSKKLVQMLALVVGGLHQLETVLPAVEALARRHVGYGVKDEHYAVVGETLLWTLDQSLGSALTDDVKAAWVAAYSALSGVMIAASAEAASR